MSSYDDSWVGMEPYNGCFQEMNFDGLIKCVFSGFEVRLCAARARSETHEIRLHPYLFPVGIERRADVHARAGDPTPRRDGPTGGRYGARFCSMPADRIGLGGYLHLTEGFPEFVDCIGTIAGEFSRDQGAARAKAASIRCPCKVAVLTVWGKLRTWTLSGHFHEVADHDLIHVIECLAGLPLEASFIDYEDVKNGMLDGMDAVICAGRRGTAWSGGELWRDTRVVEAVTAFVHDGGTFLGINEPSAVEGYADTLRMAHVLGMNIGEHCCHGNWQFDVSTPESVASVGAQVPAHASAYITDAETEVWLTEDGKPAPHAPCLRQGTGALRGRLAL